MASPQSQPLGSVPTRVRETLPDDLRLDLRQMLLLPDVPVFEYAVGPSCYVGDQRDERGGVRRELGYRFEQPGGRRQTVEQVGRRQRKARWAASMALPSVRRR